MIVLIPAYEPDGRLVSLVDVLVASGTADRVVVVDDGSGPGFAPVFDAVRAVPGTTVPTHERNRGKGVALRTGLAFVVAHLPGQDVVCADCDGQHTPDDVAAVAWRLGVEGAGATDDEPGARSAVLGARRFSGRVPLRSRFGNAVTRELFALATGRRVHDTQTGLRGYPAEMLPWLLTVPGDRFEYELNLLIRAAETRRRIVEVGIATVYLDGNSSSHFRPVADSARIYAPLLRFAVSSFSSFLVDAVALLALFAATGSLLLSVVTARVLSSSVNFLVNRHLVFRHGRERRLRVAAVRYYALAVGLLGASYAVLWLLTAAAVPLVVAKVLSEIVLFAVSYAAQRTFVFRPQSSSTGVAQADAVPASPAQAVGVSPSALATAGAGRGSSATAQQPSTTS